MKFNLREQNGFVPELKYGNKGHELLCFIPKGCNWEQINYGQGEGQVMIDGNEWGFYYADNDSIEVALHEGTLSKEDATLLVQRIGERVYGERFSNVVLTLVEKSDEKIRFFRKLIED